MKREELEILLKKYYEGTSTPGEEKELVEYFSSPDVPSEFNAEKAMFRYFKDLSSIPEPSPDFEERIINGVATANRKHRSTRILIYFSSGIAAASIVFVSLVFFLKSGAQPKDTFNDPQLAYAETMRILYNISVQLNNGAAELAPVSKMNDVDLNGLKTFDKSMKIMQKGLGNLEYLDKAIELTGKSESGMKK